MLRRIVSEQSTAGKGASRPACSPDNFSNDCSSRAQARTLILLDMAIWSDVRHLQSTYKSVLVTGQRAPFIEKGS